MLLDFACTSILLAAFGALLKGTLLRALFGTNCACSAFLDQFQLGEDTVDLGDFVATKGGVGPLFHLLDLGHV